MALGRPPPQEKRVILCVDLDYFFAQCEELRNPALRNLAVIVCMFSARGGESGAVATCNYIARKHGVKSGMPIYRAKRVLKEVPEAVFISAKESFGHYEEKSAEVMKILRGAAHKFEQVSIDEAYLDVTHKADSDFDRALELAQTIKKQVREQTGLTCSIGIGPNKLIAKMAADSKKPDGLTQVKPDEITDFLWPLPVGKLYGVGVKTEEILKENRVSTITDLAKTPFEKLSMLFGRSLASYLYNASKGIDNEPVKEREEVESISRITTLKENTREFDLIWPDVEELCKQVIERVVAEGWMFRTLTILMILEDLSTQSRSHSLETPSSSLDLLKKGARELLSSYVKETGNRMIRRVGVKVSGLVRARDQVSLREFF